MELLLPECLNIIAYYLTEERFDVDIAHLGQWYEQDIFTQAWTYSEEYFAVQKKLVVELKEHFRNLRHLAQVCMSIHQALDWKPMGRTVANMIEKRIIQRGNNDFFGGNRRDRVYGNAFIETDKVSWSNNFYYLGILRALTYNKGSNYKEVFSAFHKERTRHLHAAKEKLRIDWSKRERRPTKKPRWE